MADEEKSEEYVLRGALFIAFLKVSLCGFGGGLVWAHRTVVEQRRWISEEEFADILSLCQFMPGPNVVGIAVCAETKLRGSIGAIAAVSGFVLISWTIGFSLGVLYLQYAHLAVLQNILGGISAAATGLLIASGQDRARPQRPPTDDPPNTWQHLIRREPIRTPASADDPRPHAFPRPAARGADPRTRQHPIQRGNRRYPPGAQPVSIAIRSDTAWRPSSSGREARAIGTSTRGGIRRSRNRTALVSPAARKSRASPNGSA